MSNNREGSRNRAMQIAALNQKIEALQAQLGGAQRRANEAQKRAQELEKSIEEKDYELEALKAELSRTNEAMDDLGKEMRSMKGKEAESKPRIAESQGNISSEDYDFYKAKTAALKKDLRKLSEAATKVIQNQENATEHLEDVLEEVGDPKYRVLNYVLKKRSVRKADLASLFLLENSELEKLIDELESEEEIQLESGNTLIPGKKYREANIPLDEWEQAEPEFIFDSLEEVVSRLQGPEAISDALQKAVDILEQKLARGGAIIFQMRRAAGDWEKGGKDEEELLYQIREWKSRALDLA